MLHVTNCQIDSPRVPPVPLPSLPSAPFTSLWVDNSVNNMLVSKPKPVCRQTSMHIVLHIYTRMPPHVDLAEEYRMEEKPNRKRLPGTGHKPSGQIPQPSTAQRTFNNQRKSSTGKFILSLHLFLFGFVFFSAS